MVSLLLAEECPYAGLDLPALLQGAGCEVVLADRLADARQHLAARGFERLVVTVPPQGPSTGIAAQICMHLLRGDVPLVAILCGVQEESCAVILDSDMAVGIYGRNWPREESWRAILYFFRGAKLRQLAPAPARRLQVAEDGDGPGRISLVSVLETAMLDPACLALVKAPLDAMRSRLAAALDDASRGMRVSAGDARRQPAAPAPPFRRYARRG